VSEIDDLRAQRDRLVAAGRNLLGLLEGVGQETEWRDGEQTDRVFAWYEFDELRAALGIDNPQALPPTEASSSVALQCSQANEPVTCQNCGSAAFMSKDLERAIGVASSLPEGANFCTQCKFTWRPASALNQVAEEK
jgi:hypothetical protein